MNGDWKIYADPFLLEAIRRTYPSDQLNETFLLLLLDKGAIGMDGFRYCFKEEAVKARELARQNRRP